MFTSTGTYQNTTDFFCSLYEKKDEAEKIGNNYTTFGMLMPGRNISSDYRFLFNGMEKDDELRWNGNSYTTEFRQYDSRLGWWLGVDPLNGDAPDWSPYRFGFNNTMSYIDIAGLFESKDKAKQYAEDNNIKIRPKSIIGMLFTSGSRSNIVEQKDGSFAI